jgi:hypothetical protein
MHFKKNYIKKKINVKNGVDGNFLYYFCRTSISLKLVLNKKFIERKKKTTFSWAWGILPADPSYLGGEGDCEDCSLRPSQLKG